MCLFLSSLLEEALKPRTITTRTIKSFLSSTIFLCRERDRERERERGARDDDVERERFVGKKAIGCGRTGVRLEERSSRASFDSWIIYITVSCCLVCNQLVHYIYIYICICGCEMKRCYYAVDASYSFKDLSSRRRRGRCRRERRRRRRRRRRGRIIVKIEKTFLDDDFDAEKKTF